MRGKFIVKTITYRAGAIIITILLCSLFNLPIEISSTIGISIEIAHSLYYYIHERLWEEI